MNKLIASILCWLVISTGLRADSLQDQTAKPNASPQVTEGSENDAAASLRVGAEGGNLEAAAKLGVLYQTGQGVAQDFTEALKWLQISAEGGNANAQKNLGCMYFSAQGVDQNYDLALHWFLKAAHQGNAVAQYNSGLMYLNGQGAKQNYTQAMIWFNEADNQGVSNAQYCIGRMYENGQGVDQDTALAVSWYTKAAAQGQANAQDALKRLGVGSTAIATPETTPPESSSPTTAKTDNNEAANLRVYAAKGDVEAARKLGLLYLNGSGVIKDYVEALKWLQIAADHGDAQAEDKIGMMYQDGQGVTIDYNQAWSWFQKAAKQGNAIAQFNIGRMYLNGDGVAQDQVNAEAWFEKAEPSLNKAAGYGDNEAQWCIDVIEVNRSSMTKGTPSVQYNNDNQKSVENDNSFGSFIFGCIIIVVGYFAIVVLFSVIGGLLGLWHAYTLWSLLKDLMIGNRETITFRRVVIAFFPLLRKMF